MQRKQNCGHAGYFVYVKHEIMTESRKDHIAASLSELSYLSSAGITPKRLNRNETMRESSGSSP